MPSSYTSNLRLTLPVTGELSGTWGDTVNAGITALLDSAVAGAAAVAMTDADYTLTSVNGAADEARQMFLTVTGTLTAARNVICPTNSKLYFIKNSTTGGFAITLKTSAGTGISVPNGKVMALQVNGTNVVDAVTYFTALDAGSITTGTINATTLDLTNLEVTNIKAKDGTASISLADTTGIATFSKAAVVEVTDNTNAALRITQLGTGNALLVEDSANPDSTPFVVNAGGNVIVGNTSSLATAPANASPLFQVHRSSSNVNFASAGITNWVATSAGSGLQLSKSRSATIGTFGIVSSNDAIGRVQFNADDGTQFLAAVNIEAQVDGTPGTNDMPGRLVFSTTADGASAPTERVRISSTGQTTFSGNAIISTTDNTNAALRITQLGTGNALLVEDSTNPDVSPFVIDNGGNILQGTTTLLFDGVASISRLQSVSGGANNSRVRSIQHYGSSFGPTLSFANSASATVGDFTTAVSINNTLGSTLFFGSDGTTLIQGASIAAQVDGTPGTNDMPGRLIFSTTADGASSPTERVRIDSAGQTTFSGNAIISTTDNTNAALRITQLGTGNALLVEDSANPDASPFVVNNAGRVIQGTTTAYGVLSGGTSIPAVQTHAANATSSGTGYAAFNWATTTGSSVITYAKSRGGVVGTHAVVANGDVLGANYYYGSDGTSFIPAAYVEAEVDGTPATNDMPGRLTFGTTAAGASSSTERMRITSAGNVGVGTTSPTEKLTVQGPTVVLGSTSANQTSAGSFDHNVAANQTRILSWGASGVGGAITFWTANGGAGATQRMTIDSTGNLGVGTASPAVRLDVAGTIRSTSVSITGSAGGTITPTSDTTNQYTVTALGAAATFAIPSGTPIDGQKLTIRIKDNGTAQALTWTTSAGGYRVIGTTLPTTTVISKTVYIGCIYNSADSFWDVIAVATQA